MEWGDAVVSAIEQLGNDIKNLQVQVNMDGRKVADGVSKVVQRSTENKFGVAIQDMPTILELFRGSGLDKQVKPDRVTKVEQEVSGIESNLR